MGLRASLPGSGRVPAGGDSTTADYGKTASFLAIGVGLTGVITYVYFFIASHVLSKPDYGEITVVWSAVFITVSTLYRPVDQLLSRHISERLAKGEPLREPTLVATKIQLGLAAAFAIVTLALRGPIEDGLLDGNETLYWVFFAAGTNVEFTVTVTDTQTGTVKTYSNPLNTAAPPVQDTSAFATCP